MNPWGLSSRQIDVMNAICATGSSKGAARALNLSQGTVEEHFRRAKEKLGGKAKLICMLEWDRWWRRDVTAPSLSEQVAMLEAIAAKEAA